MNIPQKKLAIKQHRENVFVYDTETYPDEQNGDCIRYSVGFIPVSTKSNSTDYRDLTPYEIGKKKEVLVEEGEDFIDKMLKHINTK